MPIHEILPEVLSYYEEGFEDGRLRDGAGRLEFWRTQVILRGALPPTPATVLDVGGGSGIHAEWLAADGYDVALVDPVPLHIEQAGRISGVTAVIGDARALAVADASVDAVLLLGPLYHLVDGDDRVRALTEAARVVRPGGLVAAAAISRFASMNASLRRTRLDEPEWVSAVEDAVATGCHRSLEATQSRFTTAYFHRPDELRAEFAAAGLTGAEVVAVEGPGSFLPNVDDLLDNPASRAVVLRWIQVVEREPTLLGASAHLIGVAHRPEA